MSESENQANPTQLDDIVSPKQLVEERPDLFTLGRIKWYVNMRESNGLSEAGAVLRVGKSFHLVRTPFLDWFLNKRAA